MRIDLRHAQMPVLSFWQRYAFEANKDFGYVEVSTDQGKSWPRIYFVTGQKTVWAEERIDLTEYALVDDVRIRFRLISDGQTRFDGWYIDDVRIEETAAIISYPFFDDVEDEVVTRANWISSCWAASSPPRPIAGTTSGWLALRGPTPTTKSTPPWSWRGQ